MSTTFHTGPGNEVDIEGSNVNSRELTFADKPADLGCTYLQQRAASDPEPVGICGHWVSIVIKTTTPALRPQAFSLPPAAHSAYFVPWQGGRVYPQPCSQPL